MGGLYLTLLTLSCLSKVAADSVPLPHPYDYFIHFSAYFILSNWLHGEKRKIYAWPLFLIFWGGLIELGQGQVGRDCSLEDFLANSAGVIMGWFGREKGLIFSSSEIFLQIYEWIRGANKSGQ